MNRSRLQEPFMREFAANFRAVQARIVHRISDAPNEAASIIGHELRGLYHGLLVIFDGGTALADDGLVRIVDDDGIEFDRYLHEVCFKYWSFVEK